MITQLIGLRVKLGRGYVRRGWISRVFRAKGKSHSLAAQHKRKFRNRWSIYFVSCFPLNPPLYQHRFLTPRQEVETGREQDRKQVCTVCRIIYLNVERHFITDIETVSSSATAIVPCVFTVVVLYCCQAWPVPVVRYRSHSEFVFSLPPPRTGNRWIDDFNSRASIGVKIPIILNDCFNSLLVLVMLHFAHHSDPLFFHCVVWIVSPPPTLFPFCFSCCCLCFPVQAFPPPPPLRVLWVAGRQCLLRASW